MQIFTHPFNQSCVSFFQGNFWGGTKMAWKWHFPKIFGSPKNLVFRWDIETCVICQITKWLGTNCCVLLLTAFNWLIYCQNKQKKSKFSFNTTFLDSIGNVFRKPPSYLMVLISSSHNNAWLNLPEIWMKNLSISTFIS